MVCIKISIHKNYTTTQHKSDSNVGPLITPYRIWRDILVRPTHRYMSSGTVMCIMYRTNQTFLAGKKKSQQQIVAEIVKLRIAFKRLQDTMKRHIILDKYEEDINFIIANIQETLRRSEAQRVNGGRL